MTQCLIDYLKEQDVEYFENFNIASISSIGIGKKAELALSPNTEEKLIKTIDFLQDNGIKYKVVGNMTNLLPPDTDIDCVLIITKRICGYCVAEGKITVDCGALLSTVIRKIASMEYGGLEELFGIPGSVGGMVAGNAGAYGKSISDIIASARVYLPGEKEIQILSKEDMKFSYRKSVFRENGMILLSAVFNTVRKTTDAINDRLSEIINLRRFSQPYGEKSLGSVFKRFDGLAVSRLIDELGLKGMRVGGAEISKKHAGFIINSGGATAKDVCTLISLIKDKIYESYGIMVEEEIEML